MVERERRYQAGDVATGLFLCSLTNDVPAQAAAVLPIAGNSSGW